MNRLAVWTAGVLLACTCGCAGTKQQGAEIFVAEYLAATQVTFLKGRCCGRLSIDSREDAAREAAVIFARSVAACLPAGGPVDEAALLRSIPASGALGDWQEDLGTYPEPGPWHVTTSAFDWINGGGVVFQKNGFRSVAGEYYEDPRQGWKMMLEVVCLETPRGARAGFYGTGWNEGERL